MTNETFITINSIRRQLFENCRAIICADRVSIGYPISKEDREFYHFWKSAHHDITAEDVRGVCEAEIDKLNNQLTEVYKADGITNFAVVLTGVIRYDENRSLVCKFVAKVDEFKYPWKDQKEAWIKEFYNDLVGKIDNPDKVPYPYTPFSKPIKCDFFVNDEIQFTESNL